MAVASSSDSASARAILSASWPQALAMRATSAWAACAKPNRYTARRGFMAGATRAPARSTASDALAPPNAAESLRAASIVIAVAVWSRRAGASGSSSPAPAAAGATCRSMAAPSASVSSTPAAPKVWPISALKGCTTGARSPNKLTSAFDSIASL
jgi:hypothetical protein